ncbi:MAG: helix-turn-helix domain-containing protein [Actinobacteria bacterium]|nr:helix-turn-helix domain-containing protein [Actinomycetota bacterium]
MARPAPAVDRTVALLNFLAAHPGEPWSLSELARRVGLNKATAHAMLTTLTDAGYVLRHPVDKTFMLGPAVIAVGNAAAARQFEVVDFARGEMEALADELAVRCIASAAIGEEIVFLAASGDPQPFGLHVVIGQRVPLVPPLGTVFVAWSAPADIDDWLRRLGPNAGDAELQRFRDAVETVRRRGYSLGLEVPAARGLMDFEGDSRGAFTELGHREYVLLELEHSASYRLSHIAAPVFGPDGRVALSLNLIGFRHELRAEQVPELAARLTEATARITKAIHGKAP